MWLWLATATAAQPVLSAEELAELADVILVAEVTSVEVRWASGDGPLVESEAWLAPLLVLSGDPGASPSVSWAGGALGGVRVEVEDAPSLVEDRRYLLYLARAERGFVVLGGAGGAVPVGLVPDLPDLP